MKRAPVLVLILLLFSMISPFPASSADNPEEIHRQAIQALKQGDTEKAIELMSRAIAQNPEEYRYYNDRGVAYKRAGKLNEAFLDYTRALAIKPGFTNALNNRGVAFIGQGAYDRALEDFTEALKHGGLKSKIYANRGLAYARLGQHKKAIADFRKALSSKPVDDRAYLFMGESLEKTGDKETALKMYKRAKHVTKDQEILNVIGKRIAALEKDRAAAKADEAKKVKSAWDVTGRSNHGARHQPAKSQIKRNNRPQLIAPPRPRALAYAEQPKKPKPKAVIPSDIASVTALDNLSRKKAAASFSPATAEMYRLGRECLAESDPRKALIRYEDALQLAKRNRNVFGAAWCLLEIGRAHAAIGDHLRAATHLKKALRVFEQLGAKDESILSLVELASAYRATGLGQAASDYTSRAGKLALSQGHVKLAAALAASKGMKALPVKRPASPPKPDKAVRKNKDTRSTPGDKDSGHLERVGLGPAHSYQSSAKIRSVPARNTAPAKGTAVPKPVFRRVKKQPPESKPLVLKPAPPQPKTVEQYRADLKKLKESGDEVNMIVVLEKLADRYVQQKNQEKVVQCLTASLALREKLGLTKGIERLFLRRGLAREELGNPVLAIEDYSRCLVLSDPKGKMAAALKAKTTNAAKKIGLNPDAVLSLMQDLWKARQTGNEQAETPVFYKIGRLYEKAGRFPDALNYYRKSSASMAVQQAVLLEKIGNVTDAKESHEQAVDAFKKLDYSRYLQMIRKKGETDTLSRQYPVRPASNGHR